MVLKNTVAVSVIRKTTNTSIGAQIQLEGLPRVAQLSHTTFASGKAPVKVIAPEEGQISQSHKNSEGKLLFNVNQEKRQQTEEFEGSYFVEYIPKNVC